MLNSKSAFSFITILSLFVFNSCNPDDIEFISAHGFPDIPVNLSIFNSKYDDYNSDVPPGQYRLLEIKGGTKISSEHAPNDIISLIKAKLPDGTFSDSWDWRYRQS